MYMYVSGIQPGNGSCSLKTKSIWTMMYLPAVSQAKKGQECKRNIRFFNVNPISWGFIENWFHRLFFLVLHLLLAGCGTCSMGNHSVAASRLVGLICFLWGRHGTLWPVTKPARTLQGCPGTPSSGFITASIHIHQIDIA